MTRKGFEVLHPYSHWPHVPTICLCMTSPRVVTTSRGLPPFHFCIHLYNTASKTRGLGMRLGDKVRVMIRVMSEGDGMHTSVVAVFEVQ